MWTNDDTKDTVCKGIRVKFACGRSAGGFLYPICILVSNLSLAEFPSNDFKVVPVKGLSISGHIDPISKEVGYLCLMGTNVPQKHFFDWYYENITCPTVLNIRQQLNPLSIPIGDDDDVPIDQRFTMWGDSDIPYLQMMTSPSRIQKSIKKGIYFAKIGAKITETSQPLDLGPFFKILKMSGKKMTSEGMEKPLMILIDIIFKQLKADKILLLTYLKECSLKDLLSTAPDMMASAFNSC